MTTTKQCHHSHSFCSRKVICCVIWPILFTISIVILIIWAILQPSKPLFVLKDATVFNFNISGNPPNLLTSSFQITLSSRNLNNKIGILYYDSLDVYASYKCQQITLPTSIPPTYQRPKEANVWSPFIGGNSVPVSPYNALSLDQERVSGEIKLTIHLDGRVRWQVGSLITKKYHLHVKCPINFRNSDSGVIGIGSNTVTYKLDKTCSVSY